MHNIGQLLVLFVEFSARSACLSQSHFSFAQRCTILVWSFNGTICECVVFGVTFSSKIYFEKKTQEVPRKPHKTARTPNKRRNEENKLLARYLCVCT